MNARYARHPWLLDIPIDGVPVTPNNLAWLDWGLRLLSPAAMTAPDAVAAVLMMSGLTRWQATIARATASGEASAAEQVVFSELVTAEHYPHLTKALLAGGLSDDEADDPFAFALERALDGLESAVGSVSTGGSVNAEGAAGDGQPPKAVADDLADVEVPRDARLKEATRGRREAEAKVREAEKRLMDARRKEAELIAKARQRAVVAQERG